MIKKVFSKESEVEAPLNQALLIHINEDVSLKYVIVLAVRKAVAYTLLIVAWCLALYLHPGLEGQAFRLNLTKTLP